MNNSLRIQIKAQGLKNKHYSWPNLYSIYVFILLVFINKLLE